MDEWDFIKTEGGQQCEKLCDSDSAVTVTIYAISYHVLQKGNRLTRVIQVPFSRSYSQQVVEPRFTCLYDARSYSVGGKRKTNLKTGDLIPPLTEKAAMKVSLEGSVGLG